MDAPLENKQAAPPAYSVDLAIRLGLIAVLVYLSIRVFAPFLGLMVWAMVLAIALYPLNAKIAAAMGWRSGQAATFLVMLVILLIGVPTVMLGISFVDHMMSLYQSVAQGTLIIPEPRPGVVDWPVIGQQVDTAWRAASDNISAFAIEHQQQLRDMSRRAMGALGGAVVTLLAFLASFIVAGIMMAYAEPGAKTSGRILSRICGPRAGPELHVLSVATVRSVATGVIGVAFIQAILLGVGFMLAGIPAAGVLALGVLILGILQLPAALFVIPVVAWIWAAGDGGTVSNVVLSVYLVASGLADNVLKPMLLGRGVAVPMPVILLGALGGMIAGGLIGLFVGAVILAVGYQVFMAWVDDGLPEDVVASAGDGVAMQVSESPPSDA